MFCFSSKCTIIMSYYNDMCNVITVKQYMHHHCNTTYVTLSYYKDEDNSLKILNDKNLFLCWSTLKTFYPSLNWPAFSSIHFFIIKDWKYNAFILPFFIIFFKYLVSLAVILKWWSFLKEDWTYYSRIGLHNKLAIIL